MSAAAETKMTVRPISVVDRFAKSHAGAFLDHATRPRGRGARFRGPGPSLAPRVQRRRYVVAVRMRDSKGCIIEGYPLSPELTRFQARKMLRRVRLSIPQAGIWMWQGVL
jgi:hypothetical protein